MEETRKCSIFNNTHTMDSFEKNCHGEWYKQCNKCRSKGMGEFIPCNICGEKFREATIPNHQRTYQCQPKLKGKPKIEYYTWLFKHEATLLPNQQAQLETFRAENKHH